MNVNLSNNVLLEICVVSLDYAMAAQRAGASRIELCSDLTCGGITPNPGLMEMAREQLRIPIHVLVRPRPGDFLYSDDEFQIMRQTIEHAKQLGMDGIVLGLLDQDSKIDVARTRELFDLADPLPVTFHRAFDETPSWEESLEAVIQTGAQRLLTSGCCPKVMEGLSNLTQLVRAARDRLIVMPGGGITPLNVVEVVRATAAREIHASLLTPALSEEENANASSRVESYYHQVLKVVSLLRPIALEATSSNL
jgi:copper homeostasis protein